MKKDITVVITLWKRNYLRLQLDSIINQSVRPSEIWIIQCEHHIEIDEILNEFRPMYSNFVVIKSDTNLKYFFRFSVALMCTSTYLLMLDDDIIPCKDWLRICIAKCNEYDAVISCTGRIIPLNDMYPETIKDSNYKDLLIGDCFNDEAFNYCENDTQVDFGCNSYFIKRLWLHEFWSIAPYTFESGEDIHLSASLMIKMKIPTIVPKQLSRYDSGNLVKEYGKDEFASWTKPGFFEIRKGIFENFINQMGWQPLKWKK
jgi:hypothetical protein